MGAPAETTVRTPLLAGPKRKQEGPEDKSGRGPNNAAVVSDLEHGDAVKAKKVSFFRILQLARPEALMLVVATLALFVSSLSNVLLPTFAGRVIDIVTASAASEEGKDEALQQVNSTILLIVGIVAVGSVATCIRAYLFVAASERVVARLKKNLFSKLISQEIAFFDVTRTGELLNRLSEDTQVIKNAATLNLSETLRSLATAMIGIGFMFQTSWRLTALALLVVPAISLGIRAFGKYLRELSHRTQAASAVAAAIAEESFGAVRTVRSFAQEEYESERYAQRVDESLKLGLTQAFVQGLFQGGVSAAATFAIVAVVVYGAHLTINGQMTIGALTAFILYSLTVGLSLASLSGIYTTAMKAVGASQRVFQLLDRTSVMRSPGDKLPVKDSSEAEVRIEDVWFAYPSRPNDWVLKVVVGTVREVALAERRVHCMQPAGVNLELSPGAKVALVGPSGGGKTTIANLVERFYDPQKGNIYFNGVSLVDIDHRHLHENMSIVSQEPTLFNCTIAENISYGLTKTIDISEIKRVSKMANADEFISRFPEGYETNVGERGVRLSGGQKQRIAIARALLMDPKVLLLDEATSALDAESEYLVQDAMDRLMNGRTVLVIAHRLSTVQSADIVAVVSDGIIAERGTHEDLLDKNGIYASLVRRQLQGPTRGSTSTTNLTAELA